MILQKIEIHVRNKHKDIKHTKEQSQIHSIYSTLFTTTNLQSTMASAMHTTMVKGIMSQLSEAGHMSPELKMFFEEKILVSMGKRGRKTNSSTEDSMSDTSSTSKPKRKYNRKTTVSGEKRPMSPHKALVSKCIAYLYHTCDYKNNPCNNSSIEKTN